MFSSYTQRALCYPDLRNKRHPHIYLFQDFWISLPANCYVNFLLPYALSRLLNFPLPHQPKFRVLCSIKSSKWKFLLTYIIVEVLQLLSRTLKTKTISIQQHDYTIQVNSTSSVRPNVEVPIVSPIFNKWGVLYVTFFPHIVWTDPRNLFLDIFSRQPTIWIKPLNVGIQISLAYFKVSKRYGKFALLVKFLVRKCVNKEIERKFNNYLFIAPL